MERKKGIIVAILIFLIIVAGGVWFGFVKTPESKTISNPKIDAFAKCLTQKGVVMYGAYWCPHCQRQKKLFGGSFQYINYVECTKDVKKCQEKKIEGYPTWIFKNGERIAREATFLELAENTSCKAP